MPPTSSTPLPPSEEPDDGLAAFYDELENEEADLGVKGLEEKASQRKAAFSNRSERRLKSQLHQIALGSALLGILFLIAFFTFDRNSILGWMAAGCLIFGAIAFFAANPDALDTLDDGPF